MDYLKTFFQYIGNVYDKMCGSMSRHGILIGIIIALLIIILYSVVIHPINIDNIIQKAFEKERIENAEQTRNSIEQRIDADALIEPILENIVEKYNLDRAMLLEKHNSVSNISGVDFLYFSATLEVLNINNLDLSYIGDNFQRQYVSNMLGELVKVLKYKDYLYVPDISQCNHPHHRIMRKLNEYGANSLLFIPLRNKAQRPLVIIVFTSSADEMPVDDIIQSIKPYEKMIQDALIKE